MAYIVLMCRYATTHSLTRVINTSNVPANVVHRCTTACACQRINTERDDHGKNPCTTAGRNARPIRQERRR